MNIRSRTLDGPDWILAAGLTHGLPSPTYGRGRTCAMSGCRTVLSRYNPTSRCSCHNELH
jgi:hypothetical protein